MFVAWRVTVLQRTSVDLYRIFGKISRYSYNAFFVHTKCIMSVMRSNSESTDPMSINYLLRNPHYLSLYENHFVHIDIKFNINLQNLFFHKVHERC